MLWVARDASGQIHEFDAKPEWCDGCRWLVDESRGWEKISLPEEFHPTLAPGECRELRMVEPFDEAKERQRFERHFVGKLRLMRDDHGDYCDGPPFYSWRGWLAAKRDERGG
jgi:hypothetical protein